MPDASVAQRIAALFRKTPVLQMPDLARSIGSRSQRSLFRDLATLGYRSSYTHTGRFYTLESIPQFDADGLWRFEGVGFSRDGTLKATVMRLVETSETGRTQRELGLRLGVRVHNPLLELVEAKQLGREVVDDEYVYLGSRRGHAKEQLQRRRELAAVGVPATSPTLEVEVLLEVIHGARLPSPDAKTVAERLEARGVHASARQVATVLERHGLKKTRGSRSRRW
jgi:hypothetical protein